MIRQSISIGNVCMMILVDVNDTVGVFVHVNLSALRGGSGRLLFQLRLLVPGSVVRNGHLCAFNVQPSTRLWTWAPSYRVDGLSVNHKDVVTFGGVPVLIRCPFFKLRVLDNDVRVSNAQSFQS